MNEPGEERQRAVIERLYAVFVVPMPKQIESCPCCLDTQEVDALLRTPLRAIGGHLLWLYVSSVFLTSGSVEDFRYFLPRILDFSIRHPREAVDVEIVLGRLRPAGWDAWNEEERGAIIAAIDLLFDQAVAVADDGKVSVTVALDAESVLCGAARANLDPARWLERLRPSESAPFLGELQANLVGEPNGFWDDAQVGLRSAKAWLAQHLSEVTAPDRPAR